MLNDTRQVVVFRLDQQRFALPLAVVERVVRSAEVTPLPQAPAIVQGVINVAGRVLPVLNVRARLARIERSIGVDDQFLIARAGARTVVLVVDVVEGVADRASADVVEARGIVPGLDHVRGVLKDADGLILIHDLEAFLSLDENRALDEALVQEGSHADA